MASVPRRSGGNLAYALSQRGLNTTTDVYGPGSAAGAPSAIARAAGGAQRSSFGAMAVSPVPPTLRSGAVDPAGRTGGVPILSPLVASIPGGSTVHLIIWLVIGFVGLRWLMGEID